MGVNLFSVLYLQAMTQAAGKHMNRDSRSELPSELAYMGMLRDCRPSRAKATLEQ